MVHDSCNDIAQVNVALDLVLPDIPANRELFMLSATLLTRDGAVLARTHRPAMLPQRSTALDLLRQVTLAPLLFIGVISDTRHLHAALVENFVEGAEQPLASVVVVMRAHALGAAPPAVYRAHATITLKMGAPSPSACSKLLLRQMGTSCQSVLVVERVHAIVLPKCACFSANSVRTQSAWEFYRQ